MKREIFGKAYDNFLRTWKSLAIRYFLLVLMIVSIFDLVKIVIEFPDFIENIVRIFHTEHEHRQGALQFFSASALAAEQGIQTKPEANNSSKEILGYIISASVLLVFFVSIYTSVFHSDERVREDAKGYAQLFGGVMLGGFKTTIGL